MRILEVTPYITSSCHPEFQRNQTGFGYMVHEIADQIAKKEKVTLFSATTFHPTIDMDNYVVVGRTVWSLFSHIRVKNIVDGARFIARYKQPIQRQLRTMYLFLSTGQIESDLGKYDIVHIHGCSELTDAVIKVCRRHNKPFLVTLHGLNSFESSIAQNEAMRQYERDFLKEAAINHYPVSFISSGNMKTAADSTGVSVNTFFVVNNGCSLKPQQQTFDIRKEYGISKDDYVFASVGNVSVNKNQLQVARAWSLLPENFKSKCVVLFVGRNKKSDELVQFIESNKYQKNLILCGTQPKSKVDSYYQACNATILSSITEGFGLSVIEGFAHGKPNVTFGDLPATKDLYSEAAMVVAKDRSDSALAKAMEECSLIKFDPILIKNHAKRYSYEVMADKYIMLLKSII